MPADRPDTSAVNELYEQELAALGRACRDFVKARDEQERRLIGTKSEQTNEERFLQLLICGQITAHCAKVYNLSPQAGVRDPRTLFTGRPE